MTLLESGRIFGNKILKNNLTFSFMIFFFVGRNILASYGPFMLFVGFVTIVS